MSSGNIITMLLASAIIGYGAYMLVKSLKKQAKGDCVGCSHQGDAGCGCESKGR
ncbi:hypothetical protein HNQ80_002892 [Anaerosolibacter carboniphilus]|uniref:FeoB-associated Cys-rich membrane protein n=1 Tax=Anaerosolibacter carboniphilus TaxID=1417629 RepID=A0A841KX14_9FIRM|nr:FeoB-associated Cys-rich membrane protein [Anaerosolibacter carboniphilus]MBB6216788.1 hypothetical protein [Anaerosolibacter carboniphilus]